MEVSLSTIILLFQGLEGLYAVVFSCWWKICRKMR